MDLNVPVILNRDCVSGEAEAGQACVNAADESDRLSHLSIKQKIVTSYFECLSGFLLGMFFVLITIRGFIFDFLKIHFVYTAE